MLFIPMAVGAGLGALSGFLGSKKANQPTKKTIDMTTTSQLDPYGGTGFLDFLLGQGQGIYGGNKQRKWNRRMGRAVKEMGRRAGLFGGDGGGGGYGGGAGFAAQGGGGRRGGGGGDGIRGFGNYLANYQVNPNEWMRSVLEGQYLDLDSNPYLQDYMDSLRREALEGYQESVVPQLDATYARAGRFGSGAYGVGQARANEEYNEALQDTISRTLMEQYGSERDRMMQALGLLSGETQGARQTLGGVKQSSIAAAAARYAADQQLRGQMAAVNAQRAAQSEAARNAMLMNYFGGAGQMGNLRMGQLQQLANLGLPIASTFGKQTQHQKGTELIQGPKTSPLAGALSGGLGGAMMGAGFGGMFGGGGGGSPLMAPFGNVGGGGAGLPLIPFGW